MCVRKKVSVKQGDLLWQSNLIHISRQHTFDRDSCTRKSIAEAQRTSGKASTTEQSQICVKNTNPAMLEQGDLLWEDNLTHCFVPSVMKIHTHLWPMILRKKKIYCKDTKNEYKGYHNKTE